LIVRHAQAQAEPFTEGGRLGRGLPGGEHGATLMLRGEPAKNIVTLAV
jgi:hypothetical protein